MKKIFFNLTFVLIILYGCNANTDTRLLAINSSPKNQLSESQYKLVFEEHSSEDRCNIENYGKPWIEVELFLNKNGMDLDAGNWLMNPYSCTLVESQNTKYMFYRISDKDSPLGIVYIINLNNKKIGLAKLYRPTGTSYYSDARREFSIDETHFSEAKPLLNQYINTLTHY